MADSAAILGDLNVYGNSGAVTKLAAHLHHNAHIVALIEHELLGKARPSTWKGKAAAGFESALGDLPKELQKLFDSYGMAGRVLSAYAHELHVHKHRAHQLADDIVHARRVIADARDARVQAKVDLDSATAIRDASASYPEDVRKAIREVARAQARLDDIHTSIAHWEGVISASMTAARNNRTDFERTVAHCCTGLGTAGRHGIQNRHYRGFDAVVHDLESVAGFIWNGLGDILDELGGLLDIGSILAGLLVVGAGILTILTDGAAAPLLEGSLEILDGVVTASIADDVGRVATGKADSSILIEDAISVIGGRAFKAALPDVTYDKVRNALEVAVKDDKGDQQKYARHLLEVFKGKTSAQVAKEGFTMSRELHDKLQELLAEAGCAKHSGSVPVHS